MNGKGQGRRSGPGGRTKSGKPRPGSGGHGRRKLAGRGATPPAELRPGHPAQRRAGVADGSAAQERPQSARRQDQPGQDGARRPEGGGRRAATGQRPGGERRLAASEQRQAPGPRRPESAQRSSAPREQRPAAREQRAAGGARRPAGGTARAPSAAEVVAGRNAVLESLRAAVPAVALHVGPRLDADDRVTEAIKRAADAGIPVVEAGRGELDRMTSAAVHQGIALRIRPYAYAHPDDLVTAARVAGQQPLIVALDGITDPRNLGAIIRSVAAFGGHGVVVPARRSAGVTAGAWKASAGTLARLPVAVAPNLARTLANYAAAGLFIAGLDARAEDEIGETRLADGPLALVVGSEGRGLSRLVAQHCDLTLRIPIGDAESLNAGVAAGIALYQVARLRAGPG